MAGKKIYAVHFENGRQKIFKNWDSCRAAVSGVPNTAFKGFASEDQAQLWLAQWAKKPVKTGIDIYVDGAFQEECPKAGWGWVAVKNDVAVMEKYGLTPMNARSRNIDGELRAALEASRWAYNSGLKALIHHDYLGISHWVEGKWKAKSDVAKEYVRSMMPFAKNTFFQKIKAHSGDRWNDAADRLANRGIEEYLLRTKEN